MPKQLRPTVARSSERQASREQLAPMMLVRSDTPAPVTFDEELAGFDVDEDIEAIIPMPHAIPAAVRAEITRLIGEYECDDLDAWLHAPDKRLDGDSPFDRVVQGDGWAVLRLLQDGEGDLDKQGPAAGDDQQPTLWLVR